LKDAFRVHLQPTVPVTSIQPWNRAGGGAPTVVIATDGGIGLGAPNPARFGMAIGVHPRSSAANTSRLARVSNPQPSSGGFFSSSIFANT